MVKKIFTFERFLYTKSLSFVIIRVKSKPRVNKWVTIRDMTRAVEEKYTEGD